MPTRRETLGLLAAAAVVPPAWASAEIGPSLDALARQKGMRFGSAISAPDPPHPRAALDDPQYRAVMAYECGVLTPTNELKWTVIHPERFGTWDFARADRIVDFAEANAMGVRGHALLWTHLDYTPKWLKEHDFGPQPRAAAEKMLVEHVERTCARYGERVESWDVINEAIDHLTGELRTHPIAAHLGRVETLDLAFHAAKAAAPRAELVYNDYMGWARGEGPHRTAVLELLEGFRKRGVPVDTLGIQGHIGDPKSDPGSPFGAYEERPWRDFLDAVAAMGYKLHVTELDVGDKRLAAPIPARDQAVADLTKAYLDILCSYKGLRDIVTWAIVDKYSWLRGLTPRADGALKRPLPYDDDFRPKPMRAAIAAALRAAPDRR